MAESGGLPSWVEAWVGKVVQVYVHGDSDLLFGVLLISSQTSKPQSLAA
jgi:hypothetical protein